MYVYHDQFGIQLRTVNDVMQFCVCCGRGDRTLAAKSVDRGYLAATGRGGSGNRSLVLTAFMLIIFRLLVYSLGYSSGPAGLHVGMCERSGDQIYECSPFRLSISSRLADREKRRSRCCTLSALIQSVNSAYR